MVSNTRWLKWFSDEDTSEEGASYAAALQDANDCLAVASMPWFQKYLDRLYEEAGRSGEIGDHITMIKSVAESNALRKERTWLLDQIAKARIFVKQAKEA